MQFRTIFAAELMRRLRSRAFIIGLVFGGLGIAMITRLPTLLVSVQLGQERTIALTGPSVLVSPASALLHDSGGFRVRRVPMPVEPPSQATLRRWKVSSLVVLSERGGRLDVLVYAADPDAVSETSIRGPLVPLNLALRTHGAPAKMRDELGFPIAVRSVTQRFANAAASAAAHAVAYLLLFLLYMLIIFNSQLVLTSVAEEKTSRVAEVLVASVNLTTLLAAKILASTVLAALQMATWVVIGGALSGSAGAGFGSAGVTALTTVNVATIAGFLVFFILGFSQMSVLFAGIGSLVNRTEDLGSVSGPLFLPVIAAFIVAIMALSNPDAPFAVVCSFVPILSPFVMFARIAVSTVPASQIAVACLIDIASVALFAIAGGRLYRVGMLLYGRTPSWAQIVRAMLAR
jgi:ABC-type Na+ efflux pump permease subunit